MLINFIYTNYVSMSCIIPHIIQYQGSKRILAPQILPFMPFKFNRLLEPFAGMAAITIAVAKEHRAKEYFINDINGPIVSILEKAINKPAELTNSYSKIWSEQFEFYPDDISHFYYIRDCFNNGDKTPENMLYLLARCVKGSVRYGKNGNFNQSPDKRRHGSNPDKISNNVHAISNLLKGKAHLSSVDYREILTLSKPGDLVYMDPPYQGVSKTRDKRYIAGLDYQEFVDSIEFLDHKGIDYLISYDGICGGIKYGSELPGHLNCKKILLDAGLSTQSTLLGKRNLTYEALYISKNLYPYIEQNQRRSSLFN
jgi:DNA adenine methylase